jgi:hypothetical protein
MSNSYSFTCKCCGKAYDELPLCFGTDYPYFYFSIPLDEIDSRVELTESLCVIDEKYFFHRGRITIPIIDYHEDLIFNVWTTISEDNFGLRNDIWNDANRTKHGPYFGWLQTLVPTYEGTLNIKTMAYENEAGLIPSIKIIEDLHPLKTDQDTGITFELAVAKVQSIMADLHRK